MQEIASGLPALVGLIEKGGVTVLLLAAAWYFWRQDAAKRLELVKTYRQRDRARAERDRYRARLDYEKIVVDVIDIERQFKDDAADLIVVP